MIVTFYSYKGGTGRSMSLANVAWILASNGHRILVIDWDLEAPGLHRYFHPFLVDKELVDSPGIIDMMWEFASAAMDPLGSDEEGWHEPFARIAPYAVSIEHRFPGRGTIDLVPSGRQDATYADQVGSFDWTGFYERLGGGAFLESLKANMRSRYDYILVDSRTGVSDTAGICTVQLPDVLVNCFTANNQSIAGSVAVARSIISLRTDPLRILPVPMRVEDGESDKLEEARRLWRTEHAPFLPALQDVDEYWGSVEVPYVVYYAYEEVLAAIRDRPKQQRTILTACESLVNHLTHGAIKSLVPLEESERQRIQALFVRGATRPDGQAQASAETSPTRSDPPRVFISYAHGSEEHVEAVRSLWILLRGLGIDARADRLATERRQDWPAWMMEQVREADFVLVVASDEYCRRADHDRGHGRGVQFEATLIRDAVSALPDRALSRFLPVLLPGETESGVPLFLKPDSTTLYRIESLDRLGVEPLLRMLTRQPHEVPPELGRSPHLPAREHAPAALTHRLTLEITCTDRRVRCRTSLGGTLLGEREARLPPRGDVAWKPLNRPPANAAQDLAAIGDRLCAALFERATLDHVVGLHDRSPLGTVVDIELRAEGIALSLPYELLRLPDGRLLCMLSGVRLHRRVPGVDRTVAGALPGPLKILIVIGAPNETLTQHPPLDIEAEMQAILDAIGGVESNERAQIRILEVGSPAEIEHALRDDQYHVLHISAHGSAAGLELEDEDGAPVPIAAGELVERLRTAGRPLPLVVLSSCAGAEGGADSLAAQLVEHGVDRVLAMQTSVTDAYATSLARQFYNALAAPDRSTVGAALASARQWVENARTDGLKSTGPAPPEYGVPTLLTAGDDLPIVDDAAPADPLAHTTAAPVGGAVRSLRVGELIGRREQLREAVTALRGGATATERFGDISGVVLTGVGGIGKTALASRIERRLAEAGWLTAVHEGCWDPSKLTRAVVGALDTAAHPQFVQARDALVGIALDEAGKLDLTCELLARIPLLVLFDDFERNLDAENGAFSDPGFGEVFERLCDAARTGKLLVTSRYPIAGADPWLWRIRVPPLSPAELRRLLLRLPALRALDAADRTVLIRTIGGHPRLIEFVDAMLRGGRGNLREVTRKLRTLAKEQDIGLAKSAPLEQTLSDAVMLGSRDILLAELLDHLDAEERELALQAAISRAPMSVADLTLARHGEGATPEQQAAVRRAASRLCDATLLSPVEDEFVIHPWITDALAHHQGEDLDRRHRAALAMRIARLRSGRVSVDDLVEICWHFSSTEQFDELVAAASEFSAAIGRELGELSVASFLGEVLGMVPEDTVGYLPLADRDRRALELTGHLTAATQRASGLLIIAKRLADQEPRNHSHQRDLSISHNNLGDLALQAGDVTTAMTHYQAALAIGQRLAELDPTNPSRQRDIGISHAKLGDLSLRVGDSAAVTAHYQAALSISQRLAEEHPADATARRDLSIGYNRLGTWVMQAGDVAVARDHFLTALAIAERVADDDPGSATAQRDVGLSHERIGDLALRAGDSQAANAHYGAALTISQRLAAQDPTNANAQRDLSVSHEKVGTLALQTGDSQTATTHYQAALTIRQRLADQDPTNANAQRDLSVSHEKVGTLALRVGDSQTAAIEYQAALAIGQRFAEQDPTNATAQRDLSVSHNKLGDLALQAGDSQTATTHYQAALTISQRLAEQDPTNATAQRDLSVSHEKLGNLALQAGDSQTATTHHQAALTISQRLAEQDPTNATAQRDLSVSHEKLGNLALQAGDSQTATTHYQTALTISQRLAEQDPTNATAQRDLSIAHGLVGGLALQMGDQASAAAHYEAALTISQRLVDQDPGSATAQRDLGIAHGLLGNLALQSGDTAASTSHYAAASSIGRLFADQELSSTTGQHAIVGLSLPAPHGPSLSFLGDDRMLQVARFVAPDTAQLARQMRCSTPSASLRRRGSGRGGRLDWSGEVVRSLVEL